MDYSVGSLADLISGSNTPNKPKVVKKAFKKVKNIDNTEQNTQVTQVKKPSKKNIQTENTAEKLFKTGKKVKKNIKSKKDKGREVSSPVKTVLAEQKPFNNAKFNENKNKRAKRKFDAVKTNTVEGEGSPPKKTKLNNNEHNAERRIKQKIQEENRVLDPEEESRTIFVGNIPITCPKKKLKKYFRKYGIIDTVRIRGIPVADLNTPKKVAAIKKEFNPNRSNVYGFVRFVKKESAEQALVENGSLFDEHHLRVHSCLAKENPDETKAIFVGNLSFNAIEDDLWKLFEHCGPISHVRIIRDSYTGMGKGFGYVNFHDSDAVQLALEMENVKLNDRELRISLCNLNAAKRNKKSNRNKKITQPGKQKQRHNSKKQSNKNVDNVTNGSEGDLKRINSEFQGTKFNDKKKRKANKGLLQKKKLVKKIAPKPK